MAKIKDAMLDKVVEIQDSCLECGGEIDFHFRDQRESLMCGKCIRTIAEENGGYNVGTGNQGFGRFQTNHFNSINPRY